MWANGGHVSLPCPPDLHLHCHRPRPPPQHTRTNFSRELLSLLLSGLFVPLNNDMSLGEHGSQARVTIPKLPQPLPFLEQEKRKRPQGLG